MTTAGRPLQATIDEASHYLIEKYSPAGRRIGWLMIASIFIEAWDLYAISFILVFLKPVFHPSDLMLGLAAAGTQGGAAIGALLGGWLSDRLGRRAVFIGTMIMFVVLGAAQAFAPDMITLIVLRFLLGIPLGSDIANGYTYIMESMPRGKREIMGNRWQFMFAVGEVIAIAVIAVLLGTGVSHDLLWRLVLGLSAVPAIVLFFLRLNLPETALWLIQRGKFTEARRVTMQMYGDQLDMLPDEDAEIPHPKLSAFVGDMWRDASKRRATLFGWIASMAQSLEFSTFAFYLPMLFVLLNISGLLTTDLITLALYLVAVVSGFIGPLITPKIGQRKLSIYGFGIVFVALIVAGVAIKANLLDIVPFMAAAMLWGHYWDSENVMTIPSMVAPPQYKGTASGVAYMFVKIPGFLGIYLFPTFFDSIGQGNATLFTALFPLVGLLAAIFILPELHGYIEVNRANKAAAGPLTAESDIS
jgi:MFS family permease